MNSDLAHLFAVVLPHRLSAAGLTVIASIDALHVCTRQINPRLFILNPASAHDRASLTVLDGDRYVEITSVPLTDENIDLLVRAVRSLADLAQERTIALLQEELDRLQRDLESRDLESRGIDVDALVARSC